MELSYIAFMNNQLYYSTRSTKSCSFELVQWQFLSSFIFLLFLCIASNHASAQVFDFNTKCQQAYKEIIQLKLKNGQSLLDEEKKIIRLILSHISLKIILISLCFFLTKILWNIISALVTLISVLKG